MVIVNLKWNCMLVKRLFSWILGFFRKKQKGFKWNIVSELPEIPFENILYIEGNIKEEDFWYALLKCPCGCGDNIMLNLMTDSSPCWEVGFKKETFSIYPSIWKTKECKSHFWLTNGEIIWA